MSLKAKYEKVLDLGTEFGVKDGYVEEEPGRLRIGGMAETQYEKDKMWDEIKKAGGENPTDIEADIKVANTAYYHKHTVKSGESLSLIAKHYYRDPMKYKQIFEANTDQLKNPDLIHPGQELVIPNLA
jgi:nucleoid-associated protein YgaU